GHGDAPVIAKERVVHAALGDDVAHGLRKVNVAAEGDGDRAVHPGRLLEHVDEVAAFDVVAHGVTSPAEVTSGSLDRARPGARDPRRMREGPATRARGPVTRARGPRDARE